jgi:hypothetical protein
MFRFSLFLLAVLIVFLPDAVLAAMPQGFKVYCGSLPGCQEGVNQYLTNLVINRFLIDFPGYARGLAGLMVAIGGAMMILGVWKEDLISKGKETITWAIIGVAFTAFAEQLITFVKREVETRAPGVDFVYSVRNTVVSTLFDLLYITLFAVCLYSGALMVMSLGKDDQFNKGKDGLFYAALGAVIINLAEVIVSAFATL